MNTAAPAPAVVLQQVRVQVAGRTLLDVPELCLAAGEHVAVVGANGAGKSTLLRVIGGQWRPSHGRVEVLGKVLSDVDDGVDAAAAAWSPRTRRKHLAAVGLLLQGLHPVLRLTARENVIIGALGRLHGRDALRSWWRAYPPALVAEADRALAAVDLGDRAAVRTDRLSGGERQKLALARLQLQQPRLVLADEPTSALDPAATLAMCQALRAVAAGPERTLLTVVHDLSLLPALADRVIGMAGGRIQWDLPCRDIEPVRLAALYRSGPTSSPGSPAARLAAGPPSTAVPICPSTAHPGAV